MIPWWRKAWFGPLAAALILLVLCLWIALAGYPGVNRSLFLWLNQFGARADFLWQNLTFLGEGLMAFVLVGCCARRDGRLIWLALLAALLAGSGAQILKHLLDMPRPAALLDLGQFYLVGAELRAHAFPSGHATTALTAGVLLTHRFPAWRVPLWMLVLGVALSRIVVGAHWPADVLAGGCLGYLGGRAALWLADLLPSFRGKWHCILAWLLLLVLSIWLYGFPLDYPAARYLQLIASGLGAGTAIWRLTSLRRRA